MKKPTQPAKKPAKQPVDSTKGALAKRQMSALMQQRMVRGTARGR